MASAAAFASSVSSARVTTICGSTTPVLSGSKGRVRRAAVSFTGPPWASRASDYRITSRKRAGPDFHSRAGRSGMGSDPRKKKRRGEKVAKRVVVWGTGFVGKLVIPGILRHPALELVGVGVSTPAKVGRDVGAFLRAGIDVCSTGVHTGEVELRGEQ